DPLEVLKPAAQIVQNFDKLQCSDVHFYTADKVAIGLPQLLRKNNLRVQIPALTSAAPSRNRVPGSVTTNPADIAAPGAARAAKQMTVMNTVSSVFVSQAPFRLLDLPPSINLRHGLCQQFPSPYLLVFQNVDCVGLDCRSAIVCPNSNSRYHPC